jgi:hypothetical protein
MEESIGMCGEGLAECGPIQRQWKKQSYEMNLYNSELGQGLGVSHLRFIYSHIADFMSLCGP